MSTRRSREPSEERQRPPATTPEAREDQLISIATDLAEKQMREGTASAQVISHYLKLGSSREKLEQQSLTHKNALLQVQKEAIESAQRVEELYEKAVLAMRSYQAVENRAIDD